MPKQPWDWADEPAPDEDSAPIREGWSKFPYGSIEDKRNPMTALQEFYDRIKHGAVLVGHDLTPGFVREMSQAKPSPETSRDIEETVKGEKLKSAMKELQYRESIPFPTKETSRQGIGFARPAAGGIYKDYGYEFENTPGQRVAPRDFDPDFPEVPIFINQKRTDMSIPRDSPEGIAIENQIIDMYNQAYGGE